jgi:hypothetical protein
MEHTSKGKYGEASMHASEDSIKDISGISEMAI